MLSAPGGEEAILCTVNTCEVMTISFLSPLTSNQLPTKQPFESIKSAELSWLTLFTREIAVAWHARMVRGVLARLAKNMEFTLHP